MARMMVPAAGAAARIFRGVRMADNFLPGFDMDKERQIDTKFEQHIQKIADDIRARKKRIERVKFRDRLIYRGYLAFTKARPDQCWKNITYTVDDRCIGCGLCEKVCPAGCIGVENGRAVHRREDCQVCLACIQLCPHRAVHMSVDEVNPNARYINKNVTVRDIIAANNTKK